MGVTLQRKHLMALVVAWRDCPLSKRTDLYTAIKVDQFGGQSTGITYRVGIKARN